jgi:predicted AAA+ superfamily ATPase
MITYDDLLEQNPWWQDASQRPEEAILPHRIGFDAVKKGLERPFAQVLLGIRRLGKSTMLRQLIVDLLSGGTDPRHILYFSFDRYAVEKTPSALETVLKLYFERCVKTKVLEVRSRCYLLIDEIQYVDYWQDIVKRFYDQNKRLKFVLTGSQSTKLRGKSKESLAGRLIEYHVQPLSFGEYRVLKGEQPLEFPSVFQLNGNEWVASLQEFQHRFGAAIESQMPQYLSFGQFPEVAAEESLDISYQYIRESVLGKILDSDLPTHYGIEHTEAFKAMAYHLMTNSSSLFELLNIGAELGISKVTVERYLGYLRDSTLISVVHNLTRSAIKKGRSLKKAYAGSTCFVCAINKYAPDFYEKVPEVFGKVIETYVWWRLSQECDDVAFWRRRHDEVDFVITDKAGDRLPIEVKFGSRIRNEELRPMLDFLTRQRLSRGMVLTKNVVDSRTIDGYRIDMMPFYLL